MNTITINEKKTKSFKFENLNVGEFFLYNTVVYGHGLFMKTCKFSENNAVCVQMGKNSPYPTKFNATDLVVPVDANITISHKSRHLYKSQ